LIISSVTQDKWVNEELERNMERRIPDLLKRSILALVIMKEPHKTKALIRISKRN
jgi:hypothetical protein